MNHSMINSSVSMSGLQQKLDIMANNLANLNTVGFKRKDATFHDILTSKFQQPAGFQQEGRLTPPDLYMGWGSKISQIQTDISQGSLQGTDNPFDFAIEGNALFEVAGSMQLNEDEEWVVTSSAWTRGGAFQLSPFNETSMILTDKHGHPVLGMEGQPILVPNNHEPRVDQNGNVYAYNLLSPESDPEQIGQLRISRIMRPQLLQEIGDNLFAIPSNLPVNNGEILQLVDLNAEDPERSVIRIHQGFLEQSNVNLTNEMTELVMVQRALQLNSRAITSADTMLGMAINLRN